MVNYLPASRRTSGRNGGTILRDDANTHAAITLKIWLPFVRTGTGTDVFTETLAEALAERGHDVQLSPFSHVWQFAPWRMQLQHPPADTDVVVANSFHAFVFAGTGIPVVSVEHHVVLGPDAAAFRTRSQAFYHEVLVRRFERLSAKRADATVAVSRYTADQLAKHLDVSDAHVIYNGIDTDFFTPAADRVRHKPDRPTRILFVGTLNRRKGADLLPHIMDELGDGYELRFTGPVEGNKLVRPSPVLIPAGRLDRRALRDAYRDADLLLFPTRLEGLGLVALEAMACETPVVASDTGPLPEVIQDGVTGRLCPIDDVGAFAAAIRDLAGDTEKRSGIGRAARETVEAKFTIRRMTDAYEALFHRLIG